MSKILVVHSEKPVRHYLEALASRHSKVASVSDFGKAIKFLGKLQPEVVVIGLEAKKREALSFLRHVFDAKVKLPIIVMAGRGAGIYKDEAMRLGASAFLEFPVEQKRFDQAMSTAIQSLTEITGAPPPITTEEQQANISELESRLNRQMVCCAGKNQVFLQSVVSAAQTSRPRVALKCPFRQQYGLPHVVYYEYIRDVCCSNPNLCPAFQRFNNRSA